MKNIEIFEKAITEQKGSLKDYGINGTMFWAYRDSKENGNDLLDFHDVIWDYDIGEIARTCRENGITEFTISSTFSSLIETLAAFEAQGFTMDGLTEVRASYVDCRTGEKAMVPAIMMAVA